MLLAVGDAFGMGAGGGFGIVDGLSSWLTTVTLSPTPAILITRVPFLEGLLLNTVFSYSFNRDSSIAKSPTPMVKFILGTEYSSAESS